MLQFKNKIKIKERGLIEKGTFCNKKLGGLK